MHGSGPCRHPSCRSPSAKHSGPGAQARNSIGLVLVAGMAIGTAFTLFFVPAIYVLIARDRKGGARGRARTGESYETGTNSRTADEAA